MTRGAEAAAVASAVVLSFGLTVAAARTHAPTFDEPLYLATGYAAWHGDTRINSQHPPLAKRIAAAPLRFLPFIPTWFDWSDPAFVDGNGWKLARRFVFEWNDADRAVRAGRTMIALLAALTAGIFYLWCRSRWGRGVAACSLFLWLLSPEMLAHGGLATTDFAVAAFFFLSVAAFDRALDQPTPLRLIGAGLATAAALLSKHSALLLLVLLPAMAIARAAAGDPARRLSWRRGALTGILVGLVAYAGIWAGYGFRFVAAADPRLPGPRCEDASGGIVAAAARGAVHVHAVPQAYGCGIADLAARSQARRAFLMGDRTTDGWWYYLPVAFLLKSPLPLLLLLAVGLAVRLPTRGHRLVVWLPAAAFTIFAMTSRVNIGLRYLLPILPFVFVVAGSAAAHLVARGGGGRRIAAVFLAWYAGGTLWHHPHHLAFFNEIAGGPYGGYRYLVDSNLDWGQDLKRLAGFVRERGLARIRLSYFGTTPPEHYGIPHDLLPSVMRPFPERFAAHVAPGDTVAVSATNLQGAYLHRGVRDLMDRLARSPLEARVGPSLFVFRADFHWLLRPALAEELYWLPQAIASYRECLEQHPEHAAEAQAYLEGALTRQARPPDDEDDQ